jgi:flagellin-like hook-associated protein FlgL
MGLLESLLKPAKEKIGIVMDRVLSNEEFHTNNYIALYKGAREAGFKELANTTRGWITTSIKQYDEAIEQVDSLRTYLGDAYIDQVKERLEGQRLRLKDILDS